MNSKTLIVIPAYNEEATIKEVVERSLPYADVCVVNDASKDKTKEIVDSLSKIQVEKFSEEKIGHKVVCVSHLKNTHIPNTVLDGMQYALENNYDYVVTLDAGLSHLPEEIPRFLDSPPADLTLGVRTVKKDLPLYRSLLSHSATSLYNFILKPIGSSSPKSNLKDITSGFRCYSRAAISLLLERRKEQKLKARSFDFLTESLTLIYRNGLKISEVPISYNYSNSSLNRKVVQDSLRMFLDLAFSRRK